MQQGVLSMSHVTHAEVCVCVWWVMSHIQRSLCVYDESCRTYRQSCGWQQWVHSTRCDVFSGKRALLQDSMSLLPKEHYLTRCDVFLAKRAQFIHDSFHKRRDMGWLRLVHSPRCDGSFAKRFLQKDPYQDSMSLWQKEHYLTRCDVFLANRAQFTYDSFHKRRDMGWLRLVHSTRCDVFFAKRALFVYDSFHKRRNMGWPRLVGLTKCDVSVAKRALSVCDSFCKRRDMGWLWLLGSTKCDVSFACLCLTLLHCVAI